MSEAMKKRTTGGYVEVRFRIPVTRVVEAKQALASYGAIAEDPESIPWEEVYPDFNGSVALRGARKREALTQKDLAHLVGVSQTHISEMEHGKRPIGKEMARRLAKALKVNYRVFL
ncbi:MAG: helix-turn-helix transcriptional regulator [Deltaproteobacteria bacterium]|nr:helix-turn-helix transcriptional regulator [Deltaproteobacteria bacterium]